MSMPVIAVAVSLGLHRAFAGLWTEPDANVLRPVSTGEVQLQVQLKIWLWFASDIQ